MEFCPKNSINFDKYFYSSFLLFQNIIRFKKMNSMSSKNPIYHNDLECNHYLYNLKQTKLFNNKIDHHLIRFFLFFSYFWFWVFKSFSTIWVFDIVFRNSLSFNFAWKRQLKHLNFKSLLFFLQNCIYHS